MNCLNYAQKSTYTKRLMYFFPPQNPHSLHYCSAYSMKKLFSLLLALLGFAAQAQVTFKITAVSASTPANATIYMAGTLNS